MSLKIAQETTSPTELSPNSPNVIDSEQLRRICLEAGADDVGFVEIDRGEVADQKEDILRVFPRAKTLVSIVLRMNREPIRSPARSVANLEFHHVGDDVNHVARKIVRELESQSIAAINPAMGFPMEMDHFPGKIWVVSHKPVAVAAGLGKMGIHRNVIHPKFGNFILLGTLILDVKVSRTGRPVDYNPCLECKLCVAACPVGAIGADGHFDFSACYTHNYREFMGGFTDWVENIADSSSAGEYRKKVSDPESSSMWQSLSYGANYKAAYCMAVCPAGEEVIGPFQSDRKSYLKNTVKPLQEKSETVYVLPGSDAEAHVSRRFPNKNTKRVGSGLRPQSIHGFLNGLPLLFQRHQAKNMDTTYHFTFTGDERHEATVVIRNQTVRILEGHQGTANLRVIADAKAWLEFLVKDRNLLWALLSRKIKLTGPPRLLRDFGRCFPT